MSKFKTSLIITGIIVLIVVAALATYFALSFAGVIITEPQELVFKVSDSIKDYDGKPLVADSYELVEGQLFEGHKAVVEYTGSQTDAGEGESGMTVKVVDEKGFDVTGEYAIKVNAGRLVVAKAELNIGLDATDVIYNGESIIFDDYTLVSGRLAEGHRVGASKTGTGMISVGDILRSSDLLPAIYDSNGQNVSYNYDVTFSMNTAKVEVVPRPLTVRPVGLEKVYDGTPLTCANYEIVSGSIVERQYMQVNYVPVDENIVDPSIVNASELEVTAQVKIYYGYDEERVDVTDNYDIDCLTATLKITPRPLILIAKSAQREFNGNELSFSEDIAPYEAVGLADGETVTVNYTGSIINTGEELNRIEGFDVMRGDSYTTGNYDVKIVDGTLIVTPAKLSLNLPNLEKEYDGQPYADTVSDYFSVAGNDFLFVVSANESLDSVVEAGQTAYSATSYDVFCDAEICNENFNITFIPGILKITPKQVILEAGETTKTYDGKPFAFSADSLTVFDTFYNYGLLDGHSILSVTATPVINASESVPCTLSVKIVDGRGTDVSKNYSITNTSVNVTINKRATSISTDSAEKIYDGQPLSAISGEGSGLVSGDYIGLKQNATPISIAEAGVYDNAFEYEIYNSQGEAVTENYQIDGVEYGTLTINKKRITISIKDAQAEYTGTGVGPVFDELVTCEPYEYADFSFNGDDFKFDTETFEDAGEYQLSIIINNYRDYFDNYEFVSGTGKFTVTRKKVDVSLGNIGQAYSGTALALQDIAYLYGEVDTGLEGFELRVVKSSLEGIVNAGKYAVDTKFEAYAGETDVTDNFEFVAGECYYTIVPLKLVMSYDYGTDADGESLTEVEKVYDGKAFEVDCSKIAFSVDSEFAYQYQLAEQTDYKTDFVYSDKIVKVALGENGEVLPQTLNVRTARVLTADGSEIAAGNVSVAQLSVGVKITKRSITVAIGTVTVDKDIASNELDDLLQTLGNSKINELLMNGDYCINCGAEVASDNVTIEYYLSNIYNSDGEDVSGCYVFDYAPAGKVVYI